MTEYDRPIPCDLSLRDLLHLDTRGMVLYRFARFDAEETTWWDRPVDPDTLFRAQAFVFNTLLAFVITRCFILMQ